MKQGKRLAYKLQNSSVPKICFHSIRQWKATMVYHEALDILFVMKFLEHNNIKDTLIYIDIERAYFPKVDDGYHVRLREPLEEIKELF